MQNSASSQQYHLRIVEFKCQNSQRTERLMKIVVNNQSKLSHSEGLCLASDNN